jgi:pyridoxamine 5'-phosphate oxidase
MKRKRSSRHSTKPGSSYISEKNARSNPFEQFELWFRHARESKVAKPDAMVLATAGAEGRPTARVVLLKEVDVKGFSFYTNYESVKGRQLSENDRAALLFYWPELHRQVRIEGAVRKLSREESYEYFSSRPRKSRIGAWASHQSEVVGSREELDAEFKKFEKQFFSAEVPLPEYWGGYRLVPNRIEFWQERPNRMHDRISYVLVGDSWRIERLSP